MPFFHVSSSAMPCSAAFFHTSASRLLAEIHHAEKAWLPKEYGIGPVQREVVND